MIDDSMGYQFIKSLWSENCLQVVYGLEIKQ